MEEQQYITHPTMQLPAQLSAIAPQVDWVYDFIFWVSVVFFVGIMVALLYFMVKYRRRPGLKSKPTGHANTLELIWTFGPVILLVLMFHWGFQVYIASAVAPDDSYNVRVRGRQWAWQFEHPNGATEDNQLHVPAGRAVRLIMSSSDVLHSFYVPEFRVKRDLVPGMFSTIWFNAIERDADDVQAVNPETGERLETTKAEVDARVDPRRVWYNVQVYCAEYCGASEGSNLTLDGQGNPTQNSFGANEFADNGGHATMYAMIHVMHPRDFDQWVANPPPPMCGDHECSPAEWGEQLFSQKGCPACHDRSRAAGEAHGTGPNFKGLFGRDERLTDGTSLTVDAEYVRHSILEPRAQVVAEFSPVMPNIPMSQQQLDALIAYLETL